MTKTTITATRSLQDIVEEFASISDTGNLRLCQARLAYEYVGSTEGKEASELRDTFRKEANEALSRHNETLLSDPAVTNLVNTWKYMLRANVDTSEDTNPRAGAVAKSAFVFASQSFRKMEENYVIPAIEAILNGADPEATFRKQTSKLLSDKKADREQKAAERERKEKEADQAITFDVLIATISLVTPENFAKFSDAEKSTLRDALTTALVVVA